jgi:hypothetical protein
MFQDVKIIYITCCIAVYIIILIVRCISKLSNISNTLNFFPTLDIINSIIYGMLCGYFFISFYLNYLSCLLDIWIPCILLSVIGSVYVMKCILFYGLIIETKQKLSTQIHENKIVEDIYYAYSYKKYAFFAITITFILIHCIIPFIGTMATINFWYPTNYCKRDFEGSIFTVIAMMIIISTYYFIFCFIIRDYSDSIKIKKQLISISFSWIILVICISTLKVYQSEKIYKAFMITCFVLPLICENILPLIFTKWNERNDKIPFIIIPNHLDDTRNMIFTNNTGMQSILINYLYEINKTKPCESVIRSVFFWWKYIRNT